MNKLQPKQPEGYHAQRLYVTDAVQDDDADTIDIRALLLTVWHGKWIILVCTLIGATLGFFASTQTTPIYRATATVMFDPDRTNIGNLQQITPDRQARGSLQDQMQVLRSTVLIERVIDQLNLDRNPEFNPYLRVPEPKLLDRFGEWVTLPPEIMEIAENMGLVSPPPPDRDPVELGRRERLAVIRNVNARIILTQVDLSRVIDISFRSTNPVTAERVANAFAQQYIEDQVASKIDRARSATDWLTNRVDELRVKVQAAEKAVEQLEFEMSLQVGQSSEITRSQLSALNGALSQARVEGSRAEAVYSRLTQALEEGSDLGAISQFRASPLIQGYRREEVELLNQRAELEFTFAVDNRAMQLIDQRLERVRERIQDEVAVIVEAAELDLRAAEAQQKALREELSVLEGVLAEQSAQQLELRQLNREAEASRVIYENFLGRLEEANVQLDLLEADAHILSPAERPLSPERVSERRTQLIATVIGAIVGVGFVFLLDRLNNCFRSSGELEEMTRETVLGVLPTAGRRMRRARIIQYVRERPKSSLVESVRNLRTSILFSNIDDPPKVVMFTSSLPREGKSTTSMLVALTSQQMGKSAIILDCDLRLPQLAGLIGAEAHQYGLMSVLEGEATIDEAVYKDAETGLHILTTVKEEQSSGVNAADILSSRKFAQLIEDLSERYDLVILDTPPTLVVSDARIISKQADAVVYLVHWNETPRGAVLEGLKELRSVGAPIAGVAMTQVNTGKAAKYAYSGYYSYKEKYTSYYTN
ncbi:GumC family protein [Ovoidimarina sediminis]|uniref:GumC family protein n=1 Tax=Ovoidimarina sediminis TaxID=3079856 RepID=UPI002915A089|nr:polysaccharide biosynthesis tyrosine autokinase [Rhodophyticola sp. MJ-SS7]MDU8945546.1 polysaccharide biosynthesis tyrosine autokinase [Rhodophyticola sp. MJ-SS7]